MEIRTMLTIFAAGVTRGHDRTLGDELSAKADSTLSIYDQGFNTQMKYVRER